MQFKIKQRRAITPCLDIQALVFIELSGAPRNIWNKEKTAGKNSIFSFVLQRIIFFPFVLAIAVTSWAQKRRPTAPSTLVVNLLPNVDLDSAFRKEPKYIKVWKYFSNPILDNDYIVAERWLESGVNQASFLVFHNDSIWIEVRSTIIIEKGYGIRDKFKKSLYRAAYLKPNDSTIITEVFPEPCLFDKTFFNKTCPKCRRTEDVRYKMPASVDDIQPQDMNYYKVNYWNMGQSESDCRENWICLECSIIF